MYRHIKLRGWDLHYKVMDSHFYLHSSGTSYDNPSRTYDTPNIEIDENPNLIVMQFTGLLDKNGKEIYEGDVIKSSQIGNSVVIWDNGFCGFSALSESREVKSECPLTHPTLFKCEVIGNIYENPELLEEEGL